MEDTAVQRLFQDMKRRGLRKLCYRRVFPGYEAMDCFLFNGQKQTARRMLRWEAASTKFARYSVEQRATNAKLERSVK